MEIFESLFVDKLIRRGVDCSGYLLKSMVVFYCKLGKVNEAKSVFHRLGLGRFVFDKCACFVILTELCVGDR